MFIALAAYFTRFAEIATLEKYSTQQDVRINHLGWRIPKDRSLQGSDRCLLIAATLIYATAEQEGLGVGRLDDQQLSDLRQRFVVSTLLV